MTEDLKAKAEALRAAATHDDNFYLKQIAADMSIVRQSLGKVLNYIAEAEKEVSEKMRRFIMYFHDLHDIKNFYNEHGVDPPPYIVSEIQRCEDRFRQLLKEAHTDGGTFEKVRREISADPDNKWDHAGQLTFKAREL